MSKMTGGIDDSWTVIACLSLNYVTKVSGKGPNGAGDNCKIEFDYSIHRLGPAMLVPVVMDPDCRDPKQWQGAVGAYLGNLLYVDLSMDAGQEGFEKAVDRIVQEIRTRQKAHGNCPSNQAAAQQTHLVDDSDKKAEVQKMAETEAQNKVEAEMRQKAEAEAREKEDREAERIKADRDAKAIFVCQYLCVNICVSIFVCQTYTHITRVRAPTRARADSLSLIIR